MEVHKKVWGRNTAPLLLLVLFVLGTLLTCYQTAIYGKVPQQAEKTHRIPTIHFIRSDIVLLWLPSDSPYFQQRMSRSIIYEVRFDSPENPDEPQYLVKIGVPGVALFEYVPATDSWNWKAGSSADVYRVLVSSYQKFTEGCCKLRIVYGEGDTGPWLSVDRIVFTEDEMRRYLKENNIAKAGNKSEWSKEWAVRESIPSRRKRPS